MPARERHVLAYLCPSTLSIFDFVAVAVLFSFLHPTVFTSTENKRFFIYYFWRFIDAIYSIVELELEISKKCYVDYGIENDFKQ